MCQKIQREYLHDEIIYLRNKKVIQEILKKTEHVFKVLENKNDRDYSFFKKVCSDFKLLEQKCIEYSKNTEK